MAKIHFLSKVFNFLISPKSKDKDEARREYILNILLFGGFGLGLVATSVNVFFAMVEGEAYDGAPPSLVFAATLIFLALYFFSRAGKAKFVALLFLATSVLSLYFTSYKWGVNVPLVLLLYGLSVIMAGILIGSMASFLLMLTHGVFLILLSFAQSTGIVDYDSSWKYDLPNIGDGIVASAMLAIIVIVSWLFNREIEKALRRARRSEKSLRKERDLLEVKVEERTKELRKTQLEKILHLYRLADFGRMTAGFFHDLVNPLTTVSLNLEQLQAKRFGARQKISSDTNKLVGRAVSGTRRMERFVKVVRKQIQKQETKNYFSLNDEIEQVIEMVGYRAKELRVKIDYISDKKIKTYGNSLRFNQLVSNLVCNAIDSYEKIRRRKKRKVIINFSKKNSEAVLIVQDFGCGISKNNLKKIFDPFFTTKSVEKGTGIGLSICKDIVEKEFKGKMKVESKEGKETNFIVEFPLKKASVGKRFNNNLIKKF